MPHASDERLSRRLAEVRPRAPAGFADAVLREVGVRALPVPEPRRPARPLAIAAIVAVAAVVLVFAAPARRGEAPPVVAPPVSTTLGPTAGTSDPAECEAGAPIACSEAAAPGALGLDAAAPAFGPADARVTVIELIDFQCGSCAAALSTAHELAALYPRDVRVVEKTFSITGAPQAQLAAEAALAANEQGRYREMRDLLLANPSDLGRPALESYARNLGLDLDRFSRALDDGRFSAQVRRDADEAVQAGVTAVPAFVINGRTVLGARPLEELRAMVDAELAR